MPQISPMSWMIILFIITMSFLLVFSSIPQTNITPKKISESKKNNLNFKW